ncbi:MAG: FHA domain-containing protein [Myxococcota bacterium]|nr:FHA domain-containing protein [Myxococcota bacterium]
MGQYGILHVIGGNDRGKQCELSRLVTQVGRGADQDLVLADIAVSRRHLKIYLQPNGYRLQDLGSGNGTLINGKRTDEAMLVDGDQIEVGNTLLRFEHPPSRPQEAAPPYASAAAPVVAVPPYASAAAPVVAAPPYPSAVAPVLPAQAGSTLGGILSPEFLAAERGRRIAFSLVTVVLLVGLVGLTIQLSRPAPQSNVELAVKHYMDGTKHFMANDYEAARKSFRAALELAPESQELRRYLDACDIEAEAMSHIAAGRKELENRRYGEALREFEKVVDKSVQYDYAQQQANDARREAAKTALTKAQEYARVNPEAALQEIARGLELDPDNPGLLKLRREVMAGTTVPVLPKDEDERPPPPRPKPKVAAVDRTTPKRPDKPTPTPAPEPILPGGDLFTNKGALLAYRSRDFAGAINAMQNFAKINRGATQARAQATIRDIEQVRGLLDKASKLEAQHPAGALAAYNEALALDRRISGGALASFLEAKISALGPRAKSTPGRPGQTPLTSPTPSPTPTAAADPARDAKADQFLQQARALAQRDPTQAKVLCRKAMNLYHPNTNHPKYQQAYQLMKSIQSRDDDED